MKKLILIADDELHIREGLGDALSMEGYDVVKASDGNEAWNLVNTKPVDLVITDLRMPLMGGQELLKKIYSAYPMMPVVVLTGHGTISDAVEAMQNGAVDFLTKPVDLKHLFLITKKAISHNDLEKRNLELEKELKELKERSSFNKLLGKSPKMAKLQETIQQVSSTKASVLITGESGVGKELVAQSVVNFSDRKDKPFIKTHLAALNGNLLESELFGHVKGAFTGAISDKKGKFELADSGTIFLDEIGEIDQSTQIKLLRVLQEREFERVGGEETIHVDVKVIAATNRNLEEEVKKGNFREDLYYRLNVVRLEVPPLRERKEDILLLAHEFLKTFANEDSKKIEGFSNEARNALNNYSWPGNVRELQNCVQSAVVMCRSSVIELSDLPASFSHTVKEGQIIIPVGSTMEEAEKQIILETLSLCKGNKSKAADVLGIGRKTILRKLADYNL